MTDYISREELIATFRANLVGEHDYVTDFRAIESLLRRMPAANVVEVVRCKDCKNYQTDWQPLSFDDGHYCAMVDTTMPYEGFCHMGERREK